jgi:transposase
MLELPDKSLRYTMHRIDGATLLIYAESKSKQSKCPCCGKISNKVHSRYIRKLQHLPIQGKKVKLLIDNKKYFCANKDCPNTTFAETFSFYEPKATKTKRLQEEILRVSLSQSSLSAERYLRNSVADVGKSTICNLLKKMRKNH